MRIVYLLLIQLIIVSVVFAAPPPLSDFGAPKGKKPIRVKITEDQQTEIDAFEVQLAKCLEQKNRPFRDRCNEKFPMPQKKRVKAQLSPKSTQKRGSKEAVNCMKIMYNEVAYQCINQMSKMLNVKTYAAWRIRRKRDLDRIEQSHAADKQFRESLKGSGWSDSF